MHFLLLSTLINYQFNGNTLTIFPAYPANVTWTIPVEFAASNLIYLLAFVATQLSSSRYFLYGLLIFYCWWTVSLYALFIIGLLVNDLDQNGYIQQYLEQLQRRNTSTNFSRMKLRGIKLLMWVTIFLISYPPVGDTIDLYAAYFQCYDVYGDTPAAVNTVRNTNRLHTSRLISGTLLFLLASYSPSFISFLSTKFIIFLGKVSFGLYLCHDMIAQMIASRVLTSSIDGGYSFQSAAILCGITYYVCLLPASYLFWKYIDEPSVRVSHQVFRTFFLIQEEENGKEDNRTNIPV